MKLKSVTKELKAKLEDIEDVCQGRKMKTLKVVRTWIEEVEGALTEAQPFLTKEKPSKNPIRRYDDSKVLIKVLKKIHRLNDFYFAKLFADEGLTLDKMPKPKPFILLSWYEDAFNQLIDSKYSVIAVEGSAGSGKSFFFKYVAAKLSRDYDTVLFLGQSIKCFADLQNEVANKLNLVSLESWKSAITVEHKASLINQSLLKMDCVLIFEGVDYHIDFSLLGIHFKNRTKVIFGISNTMVRKSIFVDLHIGVGDLKQPNSSLILCSTAGLPHEIFKDSPFLKQLVDNCSGRPKLLYLMGLCMRGSVCNPGPWLEVRRLLNTYKDTKPVDEVIGEKENEVLNTSEDTETVEKVIGKKENFDAGVVLYEMLCHVEGSPFVLFPWITDYLTSHGLASKTANSMQGKTTVNEIELDLVAGFTEMLQKYKDTLIQEKESQGDVEDSTKAEQEKEKQSKKKYWKKILKLKAKKKEEQKDEPKDEKSAADDE